MAIKTNTGTMSKAFFETSSVKKMYFGSSLVFSASTSYYTEGTENVDWIKGSSDGIVTFDGSYLTIDTGLNTDTNDVYAVTSSTVSLTGINTLKIEWEGLVSNATLPLICVCISTARLAGYTTYNLRLSGGTTSFSKKISSIDVSSLSGDYYIRIHAYKKITTVSSSVQTIVYNVWGE